MGPDRLRDALALLAGHGDTPASVRVSIGASWNRSLRSGLRPDRFDVAFDADVDLDALLVRAARPVLEELAGDLSGSTVAVVLTDGGGHVLHRVVADQRLHARLDDIFLAPGFVYAEGQIGTNAIGTALAERAPSLVHGGEHFADALTSMACAASPIADPTTGRILGAVDLTCSAIDASPLLLSLARHARRDIERRLVDDARIAERVLLQRFLQLRRGAKGPLVFVNDRRVITNAAADRLVSPADAPVLWEHASSLLAGAPGLRSELALSGGAVVAVGFEPVVDGGVVLGALLRLDAAFEPGSESASGSRPGKGIGWTDLTDTEQSVAALVVEGFTNRQVGERLFMSRYTVDTHLRSIYRKLGVRSRVELTRAALDPSDVGS